jgi:hypothetical protein
MHPNNHSSPPPPLTSTASLQSHPHDTDPHQKLCTNTHGQHSVVRDPYIRERVLNISSPAYSAVIRSIRHSRILLARTTSPMMSKPPRQCQICKKTGRSRSTFSPSTIRPIMVHKITHGMEVITFFRDQVRTRFLTRSTHMEAYRHHKASKHTMCRALIPRCLTRGTGLSMRVISILSLLVPALSITHRSTCLSTPWSRTHQWCIMPSSTLIFRLRPPLSLQVRRVDPLQSCPTCPSPPHMSVPSIQPSTPFTPSPRLRQCLLLSSVHQGQDQPRRCLRNLLPTPNRLLSCTAWLTTATKKSPSTRLPSASISTPPTDTPLHIARVASSVDGPAAYAPARARAAPLTSLPATACMLRTSPSTSGRPTSTSRTCAASAEMPAGRTDSPSSGT